MISTGQGGLLVTNNENIYRKLKLIRTHGVSDFINVEYTKLGFNFRFTDVLASIGLEQLKKLQDRIDSVKAIYSKYESGISKLKSVELIPVDLESGEIPIYVEVLTEDRSKLVKFLSDRYIQTRPSFPNLNTAGYFDCRQEFKNSKKFMEQGLTLPSGPAQPLENIELVLKAIEEYEIFS